MRDQRTLNLLRLWWMFRSHYLFYEGMQFPWTEPEKRILSSLDKSPKVVQDTIITSLRGAESEGSPQSQGQMVFIFPFIGMPLTQYKCRHWFWKYSTCLKILARHSLVVKQQLHQYGIRDSVALPLTFIINYHCHWDPCSRIPQMSKHGCEKDDNENKRKKVYLGDIFNFFSNFPWQPQKQ